MGGLADGFGGQGAGGWQDGFGHGAGPSIGGPTASEVAGGLASQIGSPPGRTTPGLSKRGLLDEVVDKAFMSLSPMQRASVNMSMVKDQLSDPNVAGALGLFGLLGAPTSLGVTGLQLGAGLAGLAGTPVGLGRSGPEAQAGPGGDMSPEQIEQIQERVQSYAQNLANQQLQSGQVPDAVNLQRQQLAVIEDLTRPFREAATGKALPTLASLALGQDADIPFQPSKMLTEQLSRGRESIYKQQSPGGLKSSRTFERLADLATGAAADDVSRFEQGQRSILTPGQLATQNLAQAGSQLGSNISGIYSSMGQQANILAQQKAQAEAQRGANIGQGIASLGDLFLSLRS